MKHINWWKTSLGVEEQNALLLAMNKGSIAMGAVTRSLEKKISDLLGIPYVVLCSSGSAALYMALAALGIGKDDEVLIPNRTYVATANAVLLAGAKVSLVDVGNNDTSIDTDQIDEKIKTNTRAIIPVHLNGRSPNMLKINEISKKYGLKVIEDACQSLFSHCEDKLLGTYGDVGCFSLGLSKLITTGYGGFCITKSKDTYNKLIRIRGQGLLDLSKYDITEFGFNFKITDMQSSIGHIQFDKYISIIDHVNRIYRTYKKGLSKLNFIDLAEVNIDQGEVPLYVEVYSKRRDKIISGLWKQGVETRPLPPSLNKIPHLLSKDLFPNSNFIDENAFILPCGPDQEIENIHHTISLIEKLRLT